MRLEEMTKSGTMEATNRVLSGAEGAWQRCQNARELEDACELEAARAALGDLWQRIGERPRLAGLEDAVQAELLLRVGSLSSRIGSAQLIEGAQETAKDLVSESARIFAKLDLHEKLAEAEIDLALCYWREGGFDEARITLSEVLARLGETKTEQRLRALVSMAILERSATRYHDALRIEMEAAPLFDECSNHALKGGFHNEFAIILKNLGHAEGRTDYIDRAFIEFAAASYHFEQAGHARYVAYVENNLGMLFLTSGKLVQAHQHLNRARALFSKLKDKGSMAQVDETRARVFLAEGRNTQAEMAVRGAVSALAAGDEKALLAEAFTTQGIALARLGRYRRAETQLKHAIQTAERAGNPEAGGLAALAVIEELSGNLPGADMRAYYQTAESLLERSQDQGVRYRLGQCARAIITVDYFGVDKSAAETGKISPTATSVAAHGNGAAQAQAESAAAWTGCSLESEVRLYERGLIKRALEATGGSVTRAARLLGITHQGLAFILNGRHQSLLTARTPAKSRRRSIFRSR